MRGVTQATESCLLIASCIIYKARLFLFEALFLFDVSAKKDVNQVEKNSTCGKKTWERRGHHRDQQFCNAGETKVLIFWFFSACRKPGKMFCARKGASVQINRNLNVQGEEKRHCHHTCRVSMFSVLTPKNLRTKWNHSETKETPIPDSLLTCQFEKINPDLLKNLRNIPMVFPFLFPDVSPLDLIIPHSWRYVPIRIRTKMGHLMKIKNYLSLKYFHLGQTNKNFIENELPNVWISQIPSKFLVQQKQQGLFCSREKNRTDLACFRIYRSN